MATQVGFSSTTRKFLAASGLALSLGSLGLFASAGTAAAGSWPADPSWPAPPSWGFTRRIRLGRGPRHIRAARGEG
jgi:hypothetical protein